MHDLPRVTFLLVADTLLVAMLVMVLGGCTTAPSQRLRHGDFIMNIGEAPVVAPAPVATTDVAVATSQPRA